MKSVRVLAVLMAAAIPCAASAAELSHDYVEAGVSRLTEDVPSVFGGDRKFDGMYLRGSAAFGDSGLYGFGAYRQGETDGAAAFNRSNAQLGVGYAYRVAPRVELLGEGSWLRSDYEGFGDDTWRASVGARAAFGERVEGWAKAHYTDQGYDSTRYSGELGALVKIDERWGVTGAVELGDREDTYTVGLRASF